MLVVVVGAEVEVVEEIDFGWNVLVGGVVVVIVPVVGVDGIDGMVGVIGILADNRWVQGIGEECDCNRCNLHWIGDLKGVSFGGTQVRIFDIYLNFVVVWCNCCGY